ncbi:MAG: division/cell wall cluster transcriptional repressor MraZ [Pseudomonadales bacterium]
MFRGIHSINMDAKGRMSVPARFRDQLLSVCGGQVVVTIDPNTKNLALYPLPRWEEIQEKIEALPSINPQARRLQQLFIGHASDLDMDGNGRILLPPMLRRYAELEKGLVLLGQGQKIEIWSEALWETRFEDIQNMSDGLEELPEEMRSLSY